MRVVAKAATAPAATMYLSKGNLSALGTQTRLSMYK